MRTLLLPEALAEAGVTVKVLPDWERAHSNGSYRWRESPEDPAGAMWHHTATSSYTPNRDKANGYLGMGDPSFDNPRLYQSWAGGRVPIYTLANAHPAPISSGYGVRGVLEEYVKQNIPHLDAQHKADDDPKWAGNTHYWNTECILDGVGTAMPDEMWDTMVTVADVLNDVMPNWTPARHIGHAMHTSRKIDLRDGRYPDMAATIAALRNDMGDTEEEDMVTHFKIGDEDALYEEVSWLLFQLGGGVINVNKNSAQVEPVLGKTNVRLVTTGDFDLIVGATGMNTKEAERLFEGGLYRWGKEIAKLRKLTYED